MVKLRVVKLDKNRSCPLYYLVDKANKFLSINPYRFTRNNGWAISFYSEEEAKEYYKRVMKIL